MTAFEVRRSIAARPEVVWGILTDAKALESNDLGITRIEGAIAPAARIKLSSEASPGRAFSLQVVEFTPPMRMVWQGGMPFGLFTGRRYFALEEAGNGTAFCMREAFSGPLAGLIGKTIPDLQPSFEKFASGLKRLSEKG